jgi:hypothetical protein
MNLKGPKLETYVSLVFTKIKPVWVGDLGTRSKNSNFYGSGLRIANLCFFALSPTSLKKIPLLMTALKKVHNVNFFLVSCPARATRGHV